MTGILCFEIRNRNKRRERLDKINTEWIKQADINYLMGIGEI
jgi:hypothetical protein